MKEVSNGSDFIIKTKILGDDSSPIPYLEVDWEVQYYTYPGLIYKAGCKNGVLSPNCNIVNDTIEIYVNKFSWGRTGQVRRRVNVSFPDSRFADGSVDVSTAEMLTSFKIV